MDPGAYSAGRAAGLSARATRFFPERLASYSASSAAATRPARSSARWPNTATPALTVTRSDPPSASGQREVEVLDGVRGCARRRCAGAVEVGARKDQRELLAAVARGQVDLAAVLAHRAARPRAAPRRPRRGRAGR